MAKIRPSEFNSGEFFENVVKQEKKKSPEDISFLMKSLKGNFFFVNFSDAELLVFILFLFLSYFYIPFLFIFSLNPHIKFLFDLKTINLNELILEK